MPKTFMFAVQFSSLALRLSSYIPATVQALQMDIHHRLLPCLEKTQTLSSGRDLTNQEGVYRANFFQPRIVGRDECRKEKMEVLMDVLIDACLIVLEVLAALL